MAKQPKGRAEGEVGACGVFGERRRRLCAVALALLACGMCLHFGAVLVRQGNARDMKAEAKQKIMQRVGARTTPTLSQLLAMRSAFDPSKASDTTVILNHWKRDSLQTQLQALAEMSIMPEQIWVCMFNSPEERQYLKIIEEAKPLFPPNTLHPITSPVNFKYYGRFQLALQARTKYVWIFDDDVLPGSRFLELLLHTIQTEDFRGLLGTIGWVMPGRQKTGKFAGYRSPGASGGLMLPDAKYNIALPRVQPVDLLCSMWFLEREWVRYLFSEIPPGSVSYKTGEDFMLSYALKKYANIESYVLPKDEARPEYMGNVDQLRKMAQKHGTTSDKMIQLRNFMFHKNLQHGGEYTLAKFQNRDQRTYLVYVDPLVELQRYQQLLEAIVHKQHAQVMYLFPGHDGLTHCRGMMTALSPHLTHLGRKAICSGKMYGVFDLDFKSFPATHMTDNNIILHTSRNLQAILHNVQPDYLISIATAHDTPSSKNPIGTRSYSRRSLTFADQADQRVILSLVNGVLGRVAERLRVPRLVFHEQDIPLAAQVLGAQFDDVKGLLYCKPRVTLLGHAGRHSEQQLEKLQSMRLFASYVDVVLLSMALRSAGQPTTTATEHEPRYAWPQSRLAVVPAMDSQPTTLASPASSGLRSDATVNRLLESLSNFLYALQSYALASPDQFVLYVDPQLEDIAPRSLLRMATSLHMVRKALTVQSASDKSASCEPVDEAEYPMLESTSRRYQATYFNELWYVPSSGVAQSGTAAETELTLRVGQSLTAQHLGFTRIVQQGFSGLYPAHTWTTLQLGLSEALKQYKFPNVTSITSTSAIESVGRATLQHAKKAATCSNEQCGILALGVSNPRRLLGSSPEGFAWYFAI